MWEYEHLHQSKQDKIALCNHLLFKYYFIYTDFRSLIRPPLLLGIYCSLLLMTLAATEIQKGKHTAGGDNSEQIIVKYFQMFGQNKVELLHCFHPSATQTNTSPCD